VTDNSATIETDPRAPAVADDAQGTRPPEMKQTGGLLEPALRFFASFGLAMFCLGGLFVITLLGTLAQADIGLKPAIDKYFSSWAFVQDVIGPLRIALPGGYLLMSLLAANLVVGGFLRMRKDRRRLGVLLTHVGIAMLLVGGAVESLFKQDTNIALVEGESKSEAQAYFDWEFAVLERLPENGADRVREWVVPAERLSAQGRSGSLRIERPEWSFAVIAESWLPNATPSRVAGVGGPHGVQLDPVASDKEPARNLPGCRVRVQLADGTMLSSLCWGAFEQPFTFEADGRTYGVMLRRQRFPVPFTLRLEDFVREVHPRTQKPRVFRSDVTLVADDGSVHERRIQMNDPMRWGGYVLYQESFGQRMDGRTYSQFAVAKNPSDRWPILAVTIVGIGLVLHFAQLLLRHLDIERKARKVGI
jgi:hypothetical protein